MTTEMQDPLFGAKNHIHLLLDPDKWSAAEVKRLVKQIPDSIGSIIVGGSYTHGGGFHEVMESCRSSNLPLGNFLSAGPIDSILSPLASFVLVPVVLGSTSSRFLVDHLITAAPAIRRLNLHVYAVAYLMLDGGRPTSAQFFTQTLPLPRHTPEIIGTLCSAARQLGLAGVYLEAGSGATAPVTPEEVTVAREASRLPVLAGGGISSLETCQTLLGAGANGVIIGTAVEKRRSLKWLTPKDRR
jgi:phosphoglycerol geranylgeranyltransferase